MKFKKNFRDSEYFKKCSFPGCTEITVKCTAILPGGRECGHNGHPDFYKYNDTHIIPVVEHAHFMKNLDTGRNNFHSKGRDSIIVAPEEVKVYTWRTYRGPDRWTRMPVNVRVALWGWDEKRE